MLEFKNAEFRNGSFRLSANWSLSQNQAVAVIGPSGSGKSTLLAGIAGFVPLTQGQMLWNNTPLTGSPDARPVSMLFQSHNLFPHLSIAQNVGLGVKPTLSLSSQDRAKVSQALASVGLDGFEARKPSALSGGQQSRAALARVLVRAQPIILLDEPFAALGPAQRGEMLNLVKEVAAELNALLIMVTHDPKEAQDLGGAAIYVDNNIAHPPRDVAELFADPPEGLKAYLG